MSADVYLVLVRCPVVMEGYPGILVGIINIAYNQYTLINSKHMFV